MQVYAVDDEGMPTGVGMSSDQTRIAFGLFFHNKHKEAEQFFEPLISKAPLFALGYACALMLVLFRALYSPCAEQHDVFELIFPYV